MAGAPQALVQFATLRGGWRSVAVEARTVVILLRMVAVEVRTVIVLSRMVVVEARMIVVLAGMVVVQARTVVVQARTVVVDSVREPCHPAWHAPNSVHAQEPDADVGATPCLPHPHHQVQLHRGPERQLRRPRRRACVPSRLPEQLNQQVRRPVDDARLLREPRGGSDEPLHPLDGDDPIQVAGPACRLSSPARRYSARPTDSRERAMDDTRQDAPITIEELLGEVPPAFHAVFRELARLTDAFCDALLNAAYKDLCRVMGALMCQEGSPVRAGKPSGWACGIVYTVGWVNCLTDPAQTPHARADAIAAGFGVSQATMHKRSAEIRDCLDVIALDPRWCTPHMLDGNPLVWMAETREGFIIDLRTAPRRVQEDAYAKGMIPYVPADRDAPVSAHPGIAGRIGPRL